MTEAADVDVAFPVEDGALGEPGPPDNFLTEMLIFKVEETQ